MNDKQFELLIQELQICKNEIIEKLEEIRYGVIDVETEVEKISIECNCKIQSKIRLTQAQIEYADIETWWVCPVHGYKKV